MSDPSPKGARVLVTVVVCIALAGAAGGAIYWIFASEPTAQSEGATRKTAALVETIVAERGTYRPRLEVLGRVDAARDIVLSPRVRGQVLAIESALLPGGRVTEGQALLRIDPADFQRALTARQGEMKQVEAELEIEKGYQIAARQEFELLGEEIDSANKSLILREPQIDSVQARLQSAKAAVEQAQLDLERATVVAPFDAQVLSRSVNVGSQVAPGDPLARLVGIDEYWILASVPLRDLRWLRFPDGEATGSKVIVRHTTAWPKGAIREASLSRLIGTVDQETRLARVLVTVPDPLGRETDGPPLILGTIVQLEIEGRPLEDVVRIEREHLRQDDTVWVMIEDALEIREVEVVFRDAEHAFLSSGVEAGEHIVTTNLATVTEGLALRRQADGVEDSK
ncbi:MAG: efflux RND transporter periplasmic adaptor subunit [Planctomycetota bacterium]